MHRPYRPALNFVQQAARDRGDRVSLRINQAAAMLFVSVQTLRNWCNEGRVPHYWTRDGRPDFGRERGERRFYLDEIEQWITDNQPRSRTA